eukprot:scaffold150463_cov24-Cyclotella_meneghiniana.AAC.1
MSISMIMRKGYYLMLVKLKNGSCVGTITGQRYAMPLADPLVTLVACKQYPDPLKRVKCCLQHVMISVFCP